MKSSGIFCKVNLYKRMVCLFKIVLPLHHNYEKQQFK